MVFRLGLLVIGLMISNASFAASCRDSKINSLFAKLPYPHKAEVFRALETEVRSEKANAVELENAIGRSSRLLEISGDSLASRQALTHFLIQVSQSPQVSTRIKQLAAEYAIEMSRPYFPIQTKPRVKVLKLTSEALDNEILSSDYFILVFQNLKKSKKPGNPFNESNLVERMISDLEIYTHALKVAQKAARLGPDPIYSHDNNLAKFVARLEAELPFVEFFKNPKLSTGLAVLDDQIQVVVEFMKEVNKIDQKTSAANGPLSRASQEGLINALKEVEAESSYEFVHSLSGKAWRKFSSQLSSSYDSASGAQLPLDLRRNLTWKDILDPTYLDYTQMTLEQMVSPIK